MIKQKYYSLIKKTGIIITLLSIYFIERSFIENYQSIANSTTLTSILFIIFIGVILYSLTQLIIVFSWYIQLIDSYQNFSFKDFYKIIGISQIAKYIPGNIAHIAGRYYLARKLGIKNMDITNSLVYESLLIIVSAAFVAFFYINNFNLPTNIINTRIFSYFLVLTLIIIIFYLIIFKNKGSKLLTLKKTSYIIILFIISHFIIGLILFIESHYLFNNSLTLFMLTSILAISFVVGYITPGSPGGIGIREYVFLELTSNYMPESNALTIIIILRLITILGDFLMYLITFTIKDRITVLK